MSTLFGILTFAAFVCFVIGMIRPGIIVFWAKKKNRGMACLYLIPMFLFFIISLAATPSSTPASSNTNAKVSASSSTESASSSAVAEASSSESAKTYGIGEEAPIMDNGKKVGTLKINSVKTTTDRNEFDSTSPSQVVIIDYTYSNIACSDSLYISSVNLQVLDSNNTVCETYPADLDKDPQELSAGSNCDAQEAYGLKSNGKTIKLIYKNNMFQDDATLTFNLNIQ